MFYYSISEDFVRNRVVGDLVCSPSIDFSLAECDYSNTTCQSDQVGWTQCREGKQYHQVKYDTMMVLSLVVDDGTVRLVGGNGREGLLQIAYGGKWGTICSSEWTTTDVEVACQELDIEAGNNLSINPKGS